jgi:putative hemolysin
VDRFDAFCDHLIVVDGRGTVVGTYRLLPPERARAAQELHADGEFDLSALAPLRSQLVETGRSCVHPDHRTGGVIGLMWAGLARYLLLTGTRWLGDCVSVPLGDGGALAAAVWDHVRTRHLASEEQRVHPLRPWDPAGAPRLLRPTLPPLLRGYLRLGAVVCGPPAYDESFNCADFFVLLDADLITDRHWRYFLGDRR